MDLQGAGGFAAAQCGKALPFRLAHFLIFLRLCLRKAEAQPQRILDRRHGKPEAYRTVLRQSRKNLLLNGFPVTWRGRLIQLSL